MPESARPRPPPRARPVLDNPHGIRVVRLPPGRMVTSGPGTFGDDNFARFERFLRQPPDLSPRDFLCDGPAGQMVWNYILAPGTDETALDTEGLAVADFPGGLYATRVCRDNDEEDTSRTYAAITAWAAAAGYRLDGGRPGMCHMTAPDDTRDFIGYQQLDLFVPIAPP